MRRGYREGRERDKGEGDRLNGGGGREGEKNRNRKKIREMRGAEERGEMKEYIEGEIERDREIESKSEIK